MSSREAALSSIEQKMRCSKCEEIIKIMVFMLTVISRMFKI